MVWVGGDHAEVAATRSRCNRDGLHVGSSMVRRKFDQISLPRFAGWGAMGGLLLSALFARAASLGWADVLAIAPTFALASAVCAAGSLAVARRALRQELPDIPGDTAEAELTYDEKRNLLGGGD